MKKAGVEGVVYHGECPPDVVPDYIRASGVSSTYWETGERTIWDYKGQIRLA